MKQCPQCKGAYPNDAQEFCGRDGAQLVDLAEQAAFASLPISPSEIVLLNGEQFAPVSGGGFFQAGMQVPISGAMVDALQLGKMMLSAMVLACEQAGSIHLQRGPAPWLQFRSPRLFVSAGPMNIRWPQGSLEDRLCGLLSQGVHKVNWLYRHSHEPLNQGGTHKLNWLVDDLWQRNFRRNLAAAWIHARTMVLQGLAARNLISTPPDFSIVQVAPALASLPAEQTTEPLKRLFDETVTQRQPLWAALQSDIRTGVAQRATGHHWPTLNLSGD